MGKDRSDTPLPQTPKDNSASIALAIGALAIIVIAVGGLILLAN